MIRGCTKVWEALEEGWTPKFIFYWPAVAPNTLPPCSFGRGITFSHGQFIFWDGRWMNPFAWEPGRWFSLPGDDFSQSF